MVRRDIGRRGLLGRGAMLVGGALAAPAIIGQARAQGRTLKMTLAEGALVTIATAE